MASTPSPGGVNFSQAYRIASKQARHRGLSKQKTLDEGWRDTHIAHARAPRPGNSNELFRDTWREAECAGELQPAFEARAVGRRQYAGADRREHAR